MGHFINFYLHYEDKSGKGVSSLEQALAIIAEAQKLIGGGSPGVAITYSANYGQTQKIHKTYEAGGWNTQTSGANQADVMQEMESLMGGKYSSLQRQLEIAPITTIPDTYSGKTHLQVVESDLEYIKSLLDKKWDVLGWQNQGSKPHYAVGGGVAGPLPQEINTLIQTTLAKYAVDYE